MDKPVSLYDAKTHLSELVERAAAGEEIVIAKSGTPKARLVPLRDAATVRRPGAWKKHLRIAEDFDAPLPADVLDSFEGYGGRRPRKKRK